MDKNSTIYVAGHKGLVGSSIVRRLRDLGYTDILEPSRGYLDLSSQHEVNLFFNDASPDYVFLAAAKVGGIHANSTYPAQFIYDNLQIQNNVINSAKTYGVKKLLFVGSSCIYPKYCPQPMQESMLLSGHLEPTNEPYAIAKIAGIKMCQAYRKEYGCDFITAMPTNLYGPGDNYIYPDCHVIPALIRKFHAAKENKSNSVTIWGTGNALREFLFVDDLASALVFLMGNYSSSDIINVGSGDELSIDQLANIISSVVGFDGDIVYDPSKPDGTPRKLLDSSKINSMGWEREIDIYSGIEKTYEDFSDRFVNKGKLTRGY